MEKSKRGGKRVGAGRKPIGVQPKKQVAYWLDSGVVEVIRSQPNQAVFIETAVLEKSQREADQTNTQSLPK